LGLRSGMIAGFDRIKDARNGLQGIHCM
jgi:hypothetical protein